MEEIRLRDEQLEKLSVNIQALFNGLAKSQRQQQDLDMIKDLLQEFEIAMDGFKIELKHQTPSDKKVYKAKMKEHKAFYDRMKNDYEWKQTDSTRRDLIGDRKAKAVDYDSADGLMRHGLEVQQESKESLQRSVGKVHESLQVGKETAAKLDQQTEQMAGMIDKLDEIDSTLTRSMRVIKDIGRKILTDKYMWMLIVLVFAAIVFIIVYKNVIDKDAPVNAPTIPTRN